VFNYQLNKTISVLELIIFGHCFIEREKNTDYELELVIYLGFNLNHISVFISHKYSKTFFNS